MNAKKKNQGERVNAKIRGGAGPVFMVPKGGKEFLQRITDRNGFASLSDFVRYCIGKIGKTDKSLDLAPEERLFLNRLRKSYKTRVDDTEPF